jgi:hypothetical protein
MGERFGEASLILALTMSCLNAATEEWAEFEISDTLFSIGRCGVVVSMTALHASQL